MAGRPNPPDFAELRADRALALFLDFDGTLVELAPTPDSIHVPPSLADSLHELSDRLDGRLALVSGRAIVDLESHLGSLKLAVSGSHGGDCRSAAGDNLGRVPEGLPPELLHKVRCFAGDHGFDLEDKPHGVALHYRANPSLEGRGLAFARQLAGENALDVKRGKCVIELVGKGANKGSALRAFMEADSFAGAMPVFVGDDLTDEDGMRAAKQHGGFGVLVGEREESVAEYGLATPAAVQHWLGL
ncbi:trehalose-phosphatase [Aurantiacibacter gangjinensis]|uniref:Trehalose 6-phosphate phosphatase n=1 Tax=Aurantiacibacter gangjinensis TaxID=502682 RepID=A0A0G9MQS1_9SPHN|nr:trehalose-phosphatase [Aurantiacibacter gangjinensis]APE28971.1 Trehalose-6-phosphate phosphatase [Aurantiacibacter gangjinensis]KLE33087.1 hypothetical protein AAW01_03590 [Aurantiacibacter gangjinensis]